MAKRPLPPNPAPCRRATLVLLALLSGVAGCKRSPADPEEALRKVLSDVRARRGEAAWSALTVASQRELERRHQALDAASGTKTPPDPARLLFDELGLVVLNAPESIAMVSPPGREVMLRVSVKDGRSADIRMVREGDTWKIDLSGSMKPAPPPGSDLKGPDGPTGGDDGTDDSANPEPGAEPPAHGSAGAEGGATAPAKP